MAKFLIIGLGNVGAEYEHTRHNIGFEVLDALARASNLVFRTDRYAHVAELKHKGKTFILVKPTTFMNLSGNAVRYWMQAEKVSAENMLVITDDLALPFGTLRMRGKGSDGGHNGLKHIQETLGTDQYARLRCGIGSEFRKGQQVDYVLGKWSEEESNSLAEVIAKSAAACLSFGLIGLTRTMNSCNTKA